MKSIVYIMNTGLYEVEVDGDEVRVNSVDMQCYDGEFWTVEVCDEDCEPLELPEEITEGGVDLYDVVEQVVLPYLGCLSGESWMEIA